MVFTYSIEIIGMKVNGGTIAFMAMADCLEMINYFLKANFKMA